MNKKDYMAILSREMGSYTYKDVQEIVEELSAHFDIGIDNGKTEGQICEELGDPVDMAKAYKEDAATTLGDILRKKNPNTTCVSAPAKKDASGGIIFVILFNIFIGVWLWLWLAGLVLGIVGTSLTGFFGSIVGAIALAVTGVGLGAYLAPVITFLIASFLVSIAGMVLSYFLVKYYIVFLIKYIKWNSKLCKEGF